MKKIWFLLLGLLLAWCGRKLDPVAIQNYNDRLMTLQMQAVDTLQWYYQSLNSGYNGTNLEVSFNEALSGFISLKSEAQKVFAPNEDPELKKAVISYISGLQSTFIANEKPVVDLLSNFSGQASTFYREDSTIFSTYAMNLAHDLAILDKNLDSSYQSFKKKYEKELSNVSPVKK